MKGEIKMEENKNEIVVSSPEVTVLSERQSRAVTLDTTIKTRVKIIGDNLYALCQELKEMHDGKLYQELGYQNFEEYCEKEVNISRQYAYDHISVIENLPEDFVKTSLQNGRVKNKLMLIAKASEPVRTQIMQEDPKLKESYRKMKARCKELEDKQKQSESALQKKQDEITDLEKQVQELENRPVEVYHSEEDKQEIERLTIQNEALEEQRAELEQKVCEYQNQEQLQPEKTPEYQNLMDAMHNNSHEWAEKYDALQEKSWQEMNELKRKHQAEIKALQAQLAEKSAEPEESQESKQFRIQLVTISNSLEQLFDFLCDHPETQFLEQLAKLFGDAEESLDEIRKQVQG